MAGRNRHYLAVIWAPAFSLEVHKAFAIDYSERPIVSVHLGGDTGLDSVSEETQ